jgi:hypothetical protein
MVDDCIMRLAGQTTVGAAWKSIFPPALTLQSKIAIKVNTANSGLPSTHWSSVKQIAYGLAQMDFDGKLFPKANITIYDMNFQGNYDKTGFTTANIPDIAMVYTSLVDGGDGAMNNKKYASVLKEADFLINVFSPRGHTYPPAGSQFTLGFKSHVGTYASEYKGEGPALHANLMQNIRDMSCTGPVFKKNVLSVCSGIFGMNEGHGPGGSADSFSGYAKAMDSSITSKSVSPTTIMMSTDPVSIEMQSIKMLRLNANPAGKYGVADMPPYLKSAAGISGALEGTTYNIGVIDESKMEIRRIVNGVTSVDARAGSGAKISATGNPGSIHAFPVPGKTGTTFIEFSLPRENQGKTATIGIFAADGALVKRFTLSVLGSRNHFSWDNKNTAGKSVNGTFLVRLGSGTTAASTRMTIM